MVLQNLNSSVITVRKATRTGDKATELILAPLIDPFFFLLPD